MRFATAVLVVLLATSSAPASLITVLNPGFEALVLPGPGGSSNFVLSNIPDWDLSGETGTFKPGAAQFPGGVPGGVNVAAVGRTIGGGAISQTLAATLEANTTYTLMADVGQRLDFPLSSYAIELLAGGVSLGTSSSLNPAPGTFLTDTLVFESGANPAQLGQSLTIRLSATIGGQADFDNVRLDATAVPEPASFVLLGATAFGLLVLRRRQVRRA